jgi:hypothetical protein
MTPLAVPVHVSSARPRLPLPDLLISAPSDNPALAPPLRPAQPGPPRLTWSSQSAPAPNDYPSRCGPAPVHPTRTDSPTPSVSARPLSTDHKEELQ